MVESDLVRRCGLYFSDTEPTKTVVNIETDSLSVSSVHQKRFGVKVAKF